MQTVSIVELPQGGWRLRVSEPDGSYRLVGRFASEVDAARVARFNGFAVEIESTAAVAQLEFGFDSPLALSA